MSFTDEMLTQSYELLTDIDYTPNEPMKDKKALAFDIVRQIKGEEAAQAAQQYFEETFQNSEPVFERLVEKKDTFVATVAEAADVSNSEAKRLIFQNAVSVNGERITNMSHELHSGDNVKIGVKTFVKIK